MSSDVRAVSEALGAAIDECLMADVDPTYDTSTCTLAARLCTLFGPAYLAYLASTLDTVTDAGHDHRYKQGIENCEPMDTKKPDGLRSRRASDYAGVTSGLSKNTGTNSTVAAVSRGSGNSCAARGSDTNARRSDGGTCAP
jgi:hypothetical protein